MPWLRPLLLDLLGRLWGASAVAKPHLAHIEANKKTKRPKLTQRQKQAIDAEYAEGEISARECARELQKLSDATLHITDKTITRYRESRSAEQVTSSAKRK